MPIKNKKTVQIVYKRVRKTVKGGYWSAHVHYVSGLRTNYRIGRWSKAPTGGLFCFLTLSDAMKAGDGDRILECEAKKRLKLPSKKITSNLSLSASKRIWRKLNGWETNNDNLNTLNGWVAGTVCFKYLKPIKEIC